MSLRLRLDAFIFFEYIPKQLQKLVFGQRESFRNSAIASRPILTIWSDLRSSNFGALTLPKCQFLKWFGYKWFLLFVLIVLPIFSYAQTAVKKQLVVLDPGHGGFDLGAHARSMEEKALALKTAMLVKKNLNQMGYRVVLTRCRDVFIPLSKRTSIANDTKSQLFVSIHYNGHRSEEVVGIEVFYYGKGGKWRSNASRKLARFVLSRLLYHTGAPSRGVKHGNFQVIRETKMPAILIEGGFVTNPKEGGHLKREQYIEKIARAIAEGVNNYFRS